MTPIYPTLQEMARLENFFITFDFDREIFIAIDENTGFSIYQSSSLKETRKAMLLEFIKQADMQIRKYFSERSE